MQFSEKLDLLMNLTKTKNSSLALYTSLNPAHISRLRRGERKLARNENYVHAMAYYFSRHCTSEYQLKTISDFLNAGSLSPGDYDKTARLLYRWLVEEKASVSEEVGDFLDELSNFQFKNTALPEAGNISVAPHPPKNGMAVYYGIEGKRKAVLAFLTYVLSQDTPRTLLLYSDEEMDWLTEDREFTLKWAALMSRVIQRGNKIKIIHTVSRELDEMLAAIRGWMPLYMTGAIEPYYYPKKRDGVFKRTLFIAPDVAAITSTSVGNMTAGAANFLLSHKGAVKAFVEEYHSYLALCRPLMRIFTPLNKHAYLAALSEFEQEAANTIIKTETLSLLTMPLAVVENLLFRMEYDQKNQLMDYYLKRTKIFEKNLAISKFIEVVKIPDLTAIKNGRIRVPQTHMLNQDLYYTPQEFKLHLENLIYFLQTHEHYHIYLDHVANDDGYMIYAKEELGVIVIKNSAPPVILAINESNMTATFWDFMRDRISKGAESSLNRRKVITKLQAIIAELKQNSSDIME